MLGLSAGPSPHNFQFTWFRPFWIAVWRFLIIVFVVRIRDPFRDIPSHVIDPIGATPRLKRPRGCKVPKPVFPPIQIRIGTAAHKGVAPCVLPLSLTTTGFLPFRFRGKPLSRPPTIGGRLLPCLTHCRKLRSQQLGLIV